MQVAPVMNSPSARCITNTAIPGKRSGFFPSRRLQSRMEYWESRQESCA